MIASLLTAAAIFTACEETDDVTSCEVRVRGVRAVCMEASDDSYIRSECLDDADYSKSLGEVLSVLVVAMNFSVKKTITVLLRPMTSTT